MDRIIEKFISPFRAKGKAYFTCEAKYGVIARPTEVQVGDFPELDLEDVDEI